MSGAPSPVAASPAMSAPASEPSSPHRARSTSPPVGAAAAALLPPVTFEPALSGNVLRIGLLHKEGEMLRGWNLRLCVLTDRGELHYLRPNDGATDAQPAGPSQRVQLSKMQKGVINCRDSIVRITDMERNRGADDQDGGSSGAVSPSSSSSNAAAPPSGQFWIQQASGKRFVLAAKTMSDRDEWVAAVSAFGDGPDLRPVQAPNAKVRELLFGQLSRGGSAASTPRGSAIGAGFKSHRASAIVVGSSPSLSTSPSPVPSPSPRRTHGGGSHSGSITSSSHLAPKPLATLGVSQATIEKFKNAEKLYTTLGVYTHTAAGERDVTMRKHVSTRSEGGLSLLGLGAATAGSHGAAGSGFPAVAAATGTSFESILAARASLPPPPLAPPSASFPLGHLVLPSGTHPRIYYCGWLSKLGSGNKMVSGSWQRRFFVLTYGGNLLYWSDPQHIVNQPACAALPLVASRGAESKQPNDSFDVNRCTAKSAPERPREMEAGAGAVAWMDNAFTLQLHQGAAAAGAGSASPSTSARTYALAADTPLERDAWLSALGHFAEGAAAAQAAMAAAAEPSSPQTAPVPGRSVTGRGVSPRLAPVVRLDASPTLAAMKATRKVSGAAAAAGASGAAPPAPIPVEEWEPAAAAAAASPASASRRVTLHMGTSNDPLKLALAQAAQELATPDALTPARATHAEAPL